MSKSPKTPAKLSKRAETSAVQIVCMAFPVMPALILLPFLTVVKHQSGTNKIINRLVIIYYKITSSRCNLTVQIKPVQD